MDSELDSLQQLFYVIDGWMNFLIEDPLEAKVMIDIWAESVRFEKDKDMHVLLEVYVKYRDYLMSILERGIEIGEFRSIDTRSMATVIAATMDGLYLYWVMGIINLKDSVNAFKSTLSASLKIE